MKTTKDFEELYSLEEKTVEDLDTRKSSRVDEDWYLYDEEILSETILDLFLNN